MCCMLQSLQKPVSVSLGWRENSRYTDHEEVKAGAQESRQEWRTAWSGSRESLWGGMVVDESCQVGKTGALSQILPKRETHLGVGEWDCRSHLGSVLHLGPPPPPPPKNSLWTSLWPEGPRAWPDKEKCARSAQRTLSREWSVVGGWDNRQENEEHKKSPDLKPWSNQGMRTSASVCFHVREVLWCQYKWTFIFKSEETEAGQLSYSSFRLTKW